jgi:acyl-[acyl carrier protein]--UDP-N-acetylglucosamine O-acyltransferase
VIATFLSVVGKNEKIRKYAAAAMNTAAEIRITPITKSSPFIPYVHTIAARAAD